MKDKKQLSEHDQAILKKIDALDEYGYVCWPEIASLSSQLEDEETKDYWHRKCSHYNHMEEASIGCL